MPIWLKQFKASTIIQSMYNVFYPDTTPFGLYVFIAVQIPQVAQPMLFKRARQLWESGEQLKVQLQF